MKAPDLDPVLHGSAVDSYGRELPDRDHIVLASGDIEQQTLG